MVAPELVGRLGDITGAQLLADPGGRIPSPAPDLVDRLGPEVEFLAEATQSLDRAFVVLAEADIVADDDDLRAQGFDEVAAHEFLGRLGGEVEVVGLDEEAVDAGGGDEIGALPGRGDHHGRFFGTVDRARVRVEGHRDRAQALLPGQGGDGGQHRLVPAMHTVEVAEGDDGADTVDLDFTESVIQLHQTFAPSVHRLRLSQRSSAS